MNHLQHNIDMNDYADKAHRVLEYDPQSMIDDINRSNNDLKFTTAGEYMNDVNNYAKPTGGETWQTKATAKGAVPKYYTPQQLQDMKDDTTIRREEVEKKLREIGRVMVDYTSELLFPRNMAKYIRENTAFTDEEIIELLEAIDEQYVKRFGENYDKLRDRT